MNFFVWLSQLFTSAPMQTKVIHTTAKGKPVYLQTVDGAPYVHFVGTLHDDGDGAKSSHGDRDYQPTTSLRQGGRYINSDTVPGAVVYSWMYNAVPQKFLGCKGRITHIATGRSVDVVAYDVGGYDGTGEASTAAVAALDQKANPVDGGDNAADYLFEFWPGEAAPGYELQAA